MVVTFGGAAVSGSPTWILSSENPDPAGQGLGRNSRLLSSGLKAALVSVAGGWLSTGSGSSQRSQAHSSSSPSTVSFRSTSQILVFYIEVRAQPPWKEEVVAQRLTPHLQSRDLCTPMQYCSGSSISFPEPPRCVCMERGQQTKQNQQAKKKKIVT